MELNRRQNSAALPLQSDCLSVGAANRIANRPSQTLAAGLRIARGVGVKKRLEPLAHIGFDFSIARVPQAQGAAASFDFDLGRRRGHGIFDRVFE